jgi:aldoxime dehydratase
MELDSAIPEHLRRPRSRSARVGDDHVPRGAAVSPRFGPEVQRIAVACLGLQWRPGERGPRHAAAAVWLEQLTSGVEACGPDVVDRTGFTDAQGWINTLHVAYWRDERRHAAWWRRIGHTWVADLDFLRGTGRYAEVFSPTADRLEGIFDPGHRAGLARLAGAVSGPVREHGYWGSMRDRIPLSQSDALRPSGRFSLARAGGLVRVGVPHNLCLIRTGLDWAAADDEEQAACAATLEPALAAAADFMNGEGARIGCLCSRHARAADELGRPRREAFNMSVWASLAELEQWSGSHWTHLSAYGALARHGARFGARTRVTRYHEVLVLAPDQVRLDYRDCHPLTGLCGAAAAAPAARM